MKIINAEGTQVADLPDTLGEMMLKREWVKIGDSEFRRVRQATNRHVCACDHDIDAERSVQPELTGGERQLFAAGIDPDKAVPKSYLPGMVTGLTMTKLNRMMQQDLIPFTMNGQSYMIKPSDVAAAMIIAGYAYETDEPETAEAAEPIIEDEE